MSLLEIAIFFIVLIISIKRPGVGLVLLINIYAIRSLAEINWHAPCYLMDCQIGSNLLLGIILPILSLFLIVLKIYMKNKTIIYPFDKIDILLLFLASIVLIYSVFSPDIYASIEYFIKFILIGLSYYVVGKIYIFNEKDLTRVIREVFLSFYFIGLFLSLIAYLVLYLNDLVIIRLTLPGIHPIPFAQSVGMSFILSFILFFTDGKILNIKSKSFLFFNNIVLLYLTITLFATNTRGILLASILTLLLMIIFNPIRIKKIKIFIFSILFLLGTIYLVTVIDINFLFNRLLNSATDQSIGDRFIAYTDSIEIFSEHMFGVGTDTFRLYSLLPYPHNLFLQNIAEYGLLGLIWNYLFIALIIYLFYIAFTIRNKFPLSILFYFIFIYYVIETMFSFTLWMHKGLYFSMSFLSYIIYKSESIAFTFKQNKTALKKG